MCYNETDNETDRKCYRRSYRIANNLINDSRRDHLSGQVCAASENLGSRWRIINNLLHPLCGPVVKMKGWSNILAEHFDNKVKSITASISSDAKVEQSGAHVHILRNRTYVGLTLNELPLVTADEVYTMINTMRCKSSLDYIPTKKIEIMR